MSKFKRVLSDEYIDEVVLSSPITIGKSLNRSKDFILMIEQDVLARLVEQEPSGYVAKAPFDADYFKYGAGINLYKQEAHLLSEARKATPIPLYAHPMPAIKQEPVAWFTEDHLTDKSATTYEPAVRDRWIDKGWPVSPLYAHPCVSSVSVKQACDSQNEKYETQIPDGTLTDEGTKKNHIPDAWEMVVPDGWQLAPKEPTEAMITESIDAGRIDEDDVLQVWADMLAAAPKYEEGSQ